MTEYSSKYMIIFKSKKLHKALKVLAAENELSLHDMIIKACETYVTMSQEQRKQYNLMNHLDE